jgi:hypothetical protein
MGKSALSPSPLRFKEEIAMAHSLHTIPIDHTTIPAEGPYIITEANDTHAMYLDGQLVGLARTHPDAEVTLQELINEITWQTKVETADIEAERAALLLEVS